MAVVEMGKLNLVGMSYDRDAVMNALQRTGATEIKLHYDIENTSPIAADFGKLKERLSYVETSLAVLSSHTEEYTKERKIKSDILKDGFSVSYSEFFSAKDKGAEVDALIKKTDELSDGERELNAELSKTRRTLASAQIYKAVKEPLFSFSDTAHVKVKLGTVPAAAKDNLFAALNNSSLAYYRQLAATEEEILLLVAEHKSSNEAESALQEAGFVPCPFTGEYSGAELCRSLSAREAEIKEALSANAEEFYALSPQIRTLKVYCDYLAFELEKAEQSEKMRETRTTFLLEAYVPKEAEELVKKALEEVSSAVYFEFSEPAEDEIPPTLLKNNAVVKNFETITNMYSPVSYKEFDPNTVMAFFYSLFLGFIMGDIGYGLLMVVLGGFVYFKNRSRDSGLKRLSGVFAVGGIFAVVWGFLFNSLFGITMTFMPTVMPDAKDGMWTFIGIKIPSVLIISLEIGILQLFVGYVCRAWQCWRRKKVWDGILDGVVWAVFSVGVGLAIAGLVEEAKASSLALVGGITAGTSLLVAVFTAGRKEKLLGKFTKGFGAAYGVINYASDVLSYARLYGLMLSGAVIAQIVSQYAIEFITGGNAGLAILGVILMLVGHAFNLAIGLLGAYIHDARLQYVEFYGRFYEGEGELFTPLGSRHKYVYIED